MQSLKWSIIRLFQCGIPAVVTGKYTGKRDNELSVQEGDVVST